MNTTLRSAALGLGVIAVAGLAVAGPARADVVSAQQLSLLDQFNLVVLGNLNDSADVEGRAFVGGNVSGSFTNGLTPGDITPSPAGYNTLTVDGNVSGQVNINNGGFTVGGNAANINANHSGGTVSQVGGNVANINLNGGALHYGGNASGNINLNGGATKAQVAGLSTNPLPVSTFNTLSALSLTLNGLTATSTAFVDGGNHAIFNAVAGANGQAVFNISASLAAQIFSAASFQFNLGTATSVIINVDDSGTINDTANFNGTAIAQNLLWNFVGTQDINFGTEFAGTVLATNATVTNSGPIDGTLVAANANLNGEVHSHPYDGTLPDPGGVPVPEPASGAVILVGLGALTMLRRRRAS
jgi:choice-of-anchor A domain-containing protein